MALIDQIIGLFSPRREFTRLRYRLANEQLRSYEGAARTKRTSNWKAGGGSQNAEIQGSLSTLRNRSRDLIRNNPYANRGIQAIATNTIGRGIQANITCSDPKLQEKLQKLWNEWALSQSCDVDGQMNFNGMQFMATRSMAESGEVLARKRIVGRGDQFPLKIQILESDFLRTDLVQFEDPKGKKIIQGVEFDSNGVRKNYHLYQGHPGGLGIEKSYTDAYKTVVVPASDIIHMFRTERPGQVRGVPWIAPVMIRIRDFDDFEDAHLMRQKIAACFSVFIKDMDPEDAMRTKDEDGIPISDRVTPGAIEILPPGKSIEFADPPGVQGYGEYSSNVLHAIAAGLGVTYESLTGDLSQVNFSSGRMGWLEFGRNIDSWRDSIVNPQFNQRVWEWFLETCAIMGIPTGDATVSWVSPKREMIDPSKEIDAQVTGIRAGLITLSDAIRAGGKDPLRHLTEIAADYEMLDKLGLKLESDPRQQKQSQGQTVAPAAEKGASES